MENSIELLKESGELINHCIGKFLMGEAELYKVEKLRDEIDAALAVPEPDAMELVRKIREELNPMFYLLDEKQAAALIAGFGRRVPRAMLEELCEYGLNCAFISETSRKIDLAAIATKYGYRAE